MNSILSQATKPQVISSSQDKTIRTYDMTAGKCMTTLTHHKKGIRALAMHPIEHTFASGAGDSLKQWKVSFIFTTHFDWSRERKKVISFYEGFNEEMCVFIQQHVPLLILSQIFIPFR